LKDSVDPHDAMPSFGHKWRAAPPKKQRLLRLNLWKLHETAWFLHDSLPQLLQIGAQMWV